MDTHPTYRSLLRVSVVVTACVLVFQSGLLSEQTTAMYDDTIQYLGAAVGMSATVAPNEFNTITAELTKKELLLEEREAALVEREIAVDLNSNTGGTSTDRTTYILAAVLFVQLLLIVLNYGLDFLRAKEQRSMIA